MTDPMLGLTMLVLIVVVIVMGFPTAFTLMGLGIVFGFWLLLPDSTRPLLVGQRRLRADGPAHLRCDDQRRAALHPAVHPDGLRDGARCAGGQDVLLHPARVPPRAGVACRRDPDRMHVLGHRLRPGRRRGRADGRHCDDPDAAGRLRREARVRGHHRGRHARHPDSAVGDDHRLCGGGGTVGRQALCSRDAARPLSRLSVPRLHRGLGNDSAQDRAAAAGGTDPCSGAGLAATVSAGLFAQHFRCDFCAR